MWGVRVKQCDWWLDSHAREWAPFLVPGELPTCAEVAGGPFTATGTVPVVLTHSVSPCCVP